MANYNKAQSLQGGLIVEEESNGPFITGGASSPVGLDLPVTTIFIETTPSGFSLWKKYGVGVNDWREFSAEDVLFDPGTEFSSLDVQSAIEEIGASSSPGFSFGRSGNLSSGTWLDRPGRVSSNRAGITIPISNPTITQVSCSNRNIETYDVRVYEHDGNSTNLDLLGTVSVTSARGGIFPVSISATQGRQLAVRLWNSVGKVRDLGVDLILKGGS